MRKKNIEFLTEKGIEFHILPTGDLRYVVLISAASHFLSRPEMSRRHTMTKNYIDLHMKMYSSDSTEFMAQQLIVANPQIDICCKMLQVQKRIDQSCQQAALLSRLWGPGFLFLSAEFVMRCSGLTCRKAVWFVRRKAGDVA